MRLNGELPCAPWVRAGHLPKLPFVTAELLIPGKSGIFSGLQESFLSPSYLTNGRKAEDLVFTQCGMSMLQMSKELETENGWMRSLKASGASNGQTMAGATATGTHGAAFKVGAVHDTIVGLHMITGPDKHVWLEKASYPVASRRIY